MEEIKSIVDHIDISKRYPLLNAKINGFTKVPNMFLIRQDINIYEKMIMIVLKKYKMNKIRCWPAIKTIAKDARCGITKAKETVKDLEKKGMLKIYKEKGIKSNVYEIKM